MGLIDNARQFYRDIRRESDKARLSPRLGARALAGGRATFNSSSTILRGGAAAITSPSSAEDFWRINELDTRTLSRVSPATLVELLSDLSPELSSGLWHYLRLCNPGWTAVTYRPGTEEVDTRAQAILDAFLESLPGPYAPPNEVPADTIINTLFIGSFIRGAFFGELVLSEDGRLPLNVATPDPYSARFRQITDRVLGEVYELGQWQGGEWVRLDRETIKYIPIDPMFTPYGRSIIAPALFSALFLIGLLHDLRRVISQQGWPRLDIEVDLEALEESTPGSLEDEEWREWVNDTISEVSTVYASLEPDDAYVHTSVVRVNRPVGAIRGGAEGLSIIDSLITKLERMVSRGTKMPPIILGIDDATSDANANRQWELTAAWVKSIQHIAETLLEGLLGLALECQGIRASVRFRFAELRAAEAYRDAQTERIQIANAIAKYNAGWITQDQASEEIMGAPADLPEPRIITGANVVTDDDVVGEDGLERTAVLAEIRSARDLIESAFIGFRNGSRNGIAT